MLPEILNKLVAREDLSRQEAQEAMQIIMSDNATEAQIGAFLTALRPVAWSARSRWKSICAVFPAHKVRYQRISYDVVQSG